MTRFAVPLAFLGFVGCANGPCRQLRHPELANQQAAAKAPVAGPAQTAAPATDATVLVYKADGSLQCQKTKGISADDMEKKELGGVKVFSKDKRSDGLMHIQVCGTPTGMVNVFEIPGTLQTEAEKRGFKKFDAR